MIMSLKTAFLISCLVSSEEMGNVKQKRSSEAEVRSVFLNCEIGDSYEEAANSDVARFQREELFKHNSLRHCKKKIAVTVKMCTDSEQPAADEYIPIDHVLGPNNKRIRLLIPYILRLRRQPPQQAYKLQKIDTVAGILSSSKEEYNRDGNTYPLPRKENQLSSIEKFYYNQPLDDFNENPSFRTGDEGDETHVRASTSGSSDNRLNRKTKFDNSMHSVKHTIRKDENIRLYNDSSIDYSVGGKKKAIQVQNNQFSKRHDLPQREFVLYQIGEPDLWYKAEVQLYEKISTLDGKTMWSDFTKLVPASISAMDPEWANKDLTIRYRTKDYIPKDNFSLPSGSLCLVLPLNCGKETRLKDNTNTAKYGEFIIVPIDDVIMIKSDRIGPQGDLNNISYDSSTNNIRQRRRRVIIRTTRTLMVGSMTNLDILDHGSDRFLMLPHRSPHRAQLDLEARADDNRLVVAGSSGRLTSIVSDTRTTRSTLNLQVTNTGLAAAYYRVSIRECNPSLSEFYENDSSGDITAKSLIPPMHTKHFQFELPLDSAFADALCSVSLMNDEDEPVAARDVRIKRNDRCFCIWHCECVCINDDPKLICRDMPDAQLVAAGLSPRDGPRHIRSVCYPDVVTLNLFVIFVGVLLALLILGILKAILGLCLRCVGSWGLQLLLNVPRHLDHYYESSIRCRTVVYDKDGWPVHPDSKRRTVRLVSKPMEFLLNITFFIILPCILLWDAITEITCSCQTSEVNVNKSKNSAKKCFSTHDMQMQPLLKDAPFRGKLENHKCPHIDSEHDDTEFVLMQMKKSKESLAGKEK